MAPEETAGSPSTLYAFRLGDFQCLAISDGYYVYRLDDFFANTPRELLAEVLDPATLASDTITSPYTCLHVDDGQQSILIDAGAGGIVGPTAGRLQQNMAAAGLSPAAVDIVIITHAHPDHIGGLLDAADRPVFPNARYYLWQEEYDFWSSDVTYKHVPAPWVQLARRHLFVMGDRLLTIDEETEIRPGICLLAAFGHTPGHMALAIESGQDRLLHVSDAALSPLHLQHPGWMPKFDIDPFQAAATKRQLFDRAATEGALVFAHHFPPFPALGWVEKQDDGWDWQPAAGSRNPRTPFDHRDG